MRPRLGNRLHRLHRAEERRFRRHCQDPKSGRRRAWPSLRGARVDLWRLHSIQQLRPLGPKGGAMSDIRDLEPQKRRGVAWFDRSRQQSKNFSRQIEDNTWKRAFETFACRFAAPKSAASLPSPYWLEFLRKDQKPIVSPRSYSLPALRSAFVKLRPICKCAVLDGRQRQDGF